MKPFNFLNNKIEFGPYTFTNEIMETIYNMCSEYREFIDETRNEYLRLNPNINPEDDYSYPIPNKTIDMTFPDGRLWHGGSDYDERIDKVVHYVFFDRFNGESFAFSLNEEEDNTINLQLVEIEVNGDYRPIIKRHIF